MAHQPRDIIIALGLLAFGLFSLIEARLGILPDVPVAGIGSACLRHRDEGPRGRAARTTFSNPPIHKGSTIIGACLSLNHDTVPCGN